MIARRLVLACLIIAVAMPFAFVRDAASAVFSPETFMLDNGMQVVVIPNHRAPVVLHMVWYRVGASDEPAGKTGVAHLLEHLMFKGTTRYPDGIFSQTVARIGGQENAFTGNDYTAYHQTVSREHLALIMEMESDRMTGLVLRDADVATERDVVLEERRQRTDNDPASRLREKTSAAFFGDHPYGRPVIGFFDEIAKLERADLEFFYRQHYTPQNAILVVAGDITAKELRPLAEKTYGRIAPMNARADSAPRAARVLAPFHAQQVELRDARVRQPAISLFYPAPSLGLGANGKEMHDVRALEMMAEIIDGGATTRLYRSLVVEQGIAVSAGAAYHGETLGPSRFVLYASPKPGVSLDTLQTALQQVAAELVVDGVSADELERARARMVADAVYARDSLRSGAMALGGALAIGLSIDAVETWPEQIGKISTSDVQRMAARVFEQSALVSRLLPAVAKQGQGE